jgi:small-conductance mechanosensitive channel
VQFMEGLLRSDEGSYVALRIVGILVLTWLIAKLVRKLLTRRENRKLHTKFADNILVLSIHLFGILAALNEIPNFNSFFGSLLAGSGIAALALSLAAQESLGNAINGVVLSMSRSFEVGDRIKLIGGNITGYVEDITLRHTIIRTFMNSRIIIPNSVINKEMIENSSYQDVQASGFVDVIIPHDADMALAERIMAEVVGSHPNFVDNRAPDDLSSPKVWVYVRALSVYGIELRTSVWTEGIHNNFVTCSDVRRELVHRFREAGIPLVSSNIAAPPPA